MPERDEIHTDFDVAFQEGTTLRDNDGVIYVTALTALGDLPVASGAVSLGDVFTGLSPARPPSGAIPRGSYPVDLALVRIASEGGAGTKGDVRVAAARIRFREGPATAAVGASTWVRASVDAGVDSGTCGFADGDVLWPPPEEAATEELLAILEASPATRAEALGPSVAAVRHVVGDRVVFAFSSGYGDGIYPAYWGLDDAGEPVALCLDFELLITTETVDVVLPWPLGRGAVSDSALRDAGIEARVPWLSANKLVLRSTGERHAYARWRHPEGTLSRPETRWISRGEVEIAFEGRPEGAVLVVRIPQRDVAMTPRTPR
jgi:hypothetical protein